MFYILQAFDEVNKTDWTLNGKDRLTTPFNFAIILRASMSSALGPVLSSRSRSGCDLGADICICSFKNC